MTNFSEFCEKDLSFACSINNKLQRLMFEITFCKIVSEKYKNLEHTMLTCSYLILLRNTSIKTETFSLIAKKGKNLCKSRISKSQVSNSTDTRKAGFSDFM